MGAKVGNREKLPANIKHNDRVFTDLYKHTLPGRQVIGWT
jgi:hypothetical protein